MVKERQGFLHVFWIDFSSEETELFRSLERWEEFLFSNKLAKDDS